MIDSLKKESVKNKTFKYTSTNLEYILKTVIYDHINGQSISYLKLTSDEAINYAEKAEQTFYTFDELNIKLYPTNKFYKLTGYIHHDTYYQVGIELKPASEFIKEEINVND